MIIKGLDKKYLVKTKTTAERIADDISMYVGESVKTINILSAGWDAMFGDYAVVRAARNRLWIISNSEVIPDNGWVKERCLC